MKYGTNGKLLEAVRAFYEKSKACARMENKLSGWFQVTRSKARMCNDNMAFQYIYGEECKRGTGKICWRSTAGNHHCEVGAIHDDVVMLAE